MRNYCRNKEIDRRIRDHKIRQNYWKGMAHGAWNLESKKEAEDKVLFIDALIDKLKTLKR